MAKKYAIGRLWKNGHKVCKIKQKAVSSKNDKKICKNAYPKLSKGNLRQQKPQNMQN